MRTLLLGTLLALGTAATATAAVNCGSFPNNTINSFVNDDVDGFFEGKLREQGAGNVVTTGAGVFKGNSEHQLPGSCSNSIANFQGAACNLL